MEVLASICISRCNDKLRKNDEGLRYAPYEWSIAKAVIKHTHVLLRGFYMFSFMCCCSTKSSKVEAYPPTTWERALDKSFDVEASHNKVEACIEWMSCRIDDVHLIRRSGFDELKYT